MKSWAGRRHSCANDRRACTGEQTGSALERLTQDGRPACMARHAFWQASGLAHLARRAAVPTRRPPIIARRFSRRSTPSTRQHAAARDRVSENPTGMNIAYTKGLHELGDGLYAYLQPDGGWGWSNAGLITGGGTSLLVDTLYDLRLTRQMLDAMAPVAERHPIDAAVNTHANPDHCL